ncbi:MAG TPA: helix-hairpin-helix domain-containing protein [Polyangiaceae bacterium]
MALVELQPNAPKRARDGTKTGASPSPDGGGRVATPAARGFPRLVRALRESVWAPLLFKALAILCGMLALAAIGASSIARGAGVPAPAKTGSAPRVAAAGIAPPAEPSDAGGAATDAAADASSQPDAGAPPGLTPDGKVILNRASVDELRRVPGVGPKRAQAIVDLRKKLGGRFKRVTDLLRVKGIGVRSLKKMETHLVLEAPLDAGAAPPAKQD